MKRARTLMRITGSGAAFRAMLAESSPLPRGGRPLDKAEAAMMDRLTAAFSNANLAEHELGRPIPGAPSVAVERLGQNRYRVTRYIELERVRTVDPELNDRVACPEVDFIVHDGNWFPVAARFAAPRDARDLHDVAAAMLHAVAHEQGLHVRAASGLRVRPHPLVRLAETLWARLRPRHRARRLRSTEEV